MKKNTWGYDFICLECGREVATTDTVSTRLKLCVRCEKLATPSLSNKEEERE